MVLLGAANGWGKANDETWQNYKITKEDPKKYINHVKTILNSAKISINQQKLATSVKSRKR